MSGITFPRFDGAAAWAGLSAAQQATFGAIALEMAAGWLADDILTARQLDTGLPPAWGRLHRACEQGDCQAIGELLAAAEDVVPAAAIEPVDGWPRIPSRLGPICRGCGCTEQHACLSDALPCHWAEPDLCSACVSTPDTSEAHDATHR